MAVQPTCSLAHNVVMLIGSCGDITPPPSWAFEAMWRQAASLRAPKYRFAVLLDDSQCPGRCETLEAALSPSTSMECVSALSYTSEASLALWTSSSPKDTLNRPDVSKSEQIPNSGPSTFNL